MENDSVMAVNKIVVTETQNSQAPEDAVETHVEEAIQNKLGDMGDE